MRHFFFKPFHLIEHYQSFRYHLASIKAFKPTEYFSLILLLRKDNCNSNHYPF